MVKLTHIIFGFSSLFFGLLVLLTSKGSAHHKLIGKLYVASMVILNATAFGIYELFNGFGIFHWGAVVSSLTIVCGVGVLIFRRKFKNWLVIHYDLMVWSYIGLLAATSNEMFVHVSVFKNLAEVYRYAPLVSMCLVFWLGATWVNKAKSKTTTKFLASA